MRKDIIQYLLDTIIIEKMSDPSYAYFTKEAALYDELGLGNVASAIKNFFKEQSFLDIVVTGTLFKVHPLFSLLYFVAKKVGFDIDSVVSNIVSKIKPKIEGGQQISADEVNSIGKSVVGQLAGADLGAEASDNMLQHLYNLEQDGFFKKEAYYRRSKLPDIKFFGSAKGSRWASVFGNLFSLPSRGKLVWLIGGIIIWTIKTALLGAGLLGGSAIASKLLPGSDKSEKHTHEKTERPASTHVEESSLNFNKPINGLIPSGWGQTFFPNDSTNLWVVPVINDSIKNTLLTWTVKVYPELSSKEYLIKSLNSFNNVVSQMNTNYKPGQDTLTIPEKIDNMNVNSIKNIVDIFVSNLKV